MKLVKGAQSIAYDRAPYLISSASVVGKKEGAGPRPCSFFYLPAKKRQRKGCKTGKSGKNIL